MAITQITDKIFMGSEHDSLTLAWQQFGITAIANVASNANDPPVYPEEYLHLRDQDDCVPVKPENMDKFLAWCEKVIPKHKVLFHCQMGASRVSAFTISWFIKSGWSWDEAEAFIKPKRPEYNPAQQLKDSVIEYFKTT